MKYWIIALILVVGCGVNDAEQEEYEEGYPFQIETWQVESPVAAKWTGKQATQSKVSYSMSSTEMGDTLFIDSPEGHNIRVISPLEGPDKDQFQINYTDSTLTPDFFEQNNADRHDMEIKVTIDQLEEEIWTRRHDNESTSLLKSFRYDCEESYDFEDSQMIEYTIPDKDGEPLKVVQIAIDGIIPTVDHIVCG